MYRVALPIGGAMPPGRSPGFGDEAVTVAQDRVVDGIRLSLVQPETGQLAANRTDDLGADQAIAKTQRVAKHVEHPDARQQRHQLFGLNVLPPGKPAWRRDGKPVFIEAPDSRVPAGPVIVDAV